MARAFFGIMDALGLTTWRHSLNRQNPFDKGGKEHACMFGNWSLPPPFSKGFFMRAHNYQRYLAKFWCSIMRAELGRG